MKSIIPDPEQLDELAAGLDAGWDDEPASSLRAAESATPITSRPPSSLPLPATLEALDADWDVAGSPSPARPAQRPNAVRPSPARPNATRAVTPALPIGAVPLRATKQERREAERKRRAHEAQQKAANKKQRKADRQAEARRASERAQAAEQELTLERRARPSKPRKRPEVLGEQQEPAQSTPRRAAASAKRARRERTANDSRAQGPSAPTSSKPVPQNRAGTQPRRTVVVEERGAKKLLIPLLLAIVFALTFYFALSRTR